MRTRAAVAAVLTAATSLMGVAGFAGTASAGAGGPYDNALDILSITPNPVKGGEKIVVFVQERNDTGKFIPFTLSGPCIADYFYDPAAYKLPFAYKGSFIPTLLVNKDFKGNCTITVSGTGPNGPLSDTFTINVLPGDGQSVAATAKPGASGPSGSTFEATAARAVRTESLPAQQAAVAVEASAIVVGAAPAGEARVAGVSVTNSAVTLPRTGSSSIAQAWLGAALAAVGGAFVIFARRRVRYARVRSDNSR